MQLYKLISSLIVAFLPVIGWFSPTVRKSRINRKGWRQELKRIASLTRKPIVFHCASLGEFDQAYPLIENIGAKDKNRDVVVSFFSSSGYDFVSSRYPELLTAYLPFDTSKNMHDWVDTLNPSAVLFAKYEYWPNLLHTLHKKRVPFYFFSSVFGQGHWLFKPWGAFVKKRVLEATAIFVQDENSQINLLKHGAQRVYVSGDTRVDRVLKKIEMQIPDPVVSNWCNSRPMLVLGSVHKEELELVKNAVHWASDHDWLVLLAPHHTDDRELGFWQEQLASWTPGLWSAQQTNHHVLILDTIGLLAAAYKLASLCYIGGGFSTGIHNTLEPAAAGIPVTFGPRHSSFVEASALIDAGAGHVVKNSSELNSWLHLMLNDSNRLQAAKAASEYIEKQRGATQKIMDHLTQWDYEHK